MNFLHVQSCRIGLQKVRKDEWFVVGYCALGALANSITPSRWERIIWLPVVLLALISSLFVALS